MNDIIQTLKNAGYDVNPTACINNPQEFGQVLDVRAPSGKHYSLVLTVPQENS